MFNRPQSLVLKTLCIVLFLFFSASVLAKKYENDYIKMLIPDTWACHVQENSWICHEPTSKKQIDAIYVLNAKLPGPEDNHKSFGVQLRRTKTIKDASGQLVQSELLTQKEVMVNGVKWNYAFHKNSEVYGFYTQYMATVDKGLSILISLSAEENMFDEVKEVFLRTIKSLNVKKVVPLTPEQLAKVREISPNLSSNFVVGKLKQKRPFFSLRNPKFLGLLMGLIGVVVIFFALKK